jgi:hypothetical protein
MSRKRNGRDGRNGSRQRVGVVAKVSSREAVDTAHELAEWLRRRGFEAAL